MSVKPEDFQDILIKQQALIEQYEHLVKTLKMDDTIQENEALTTQLAQLKAQYETHKKEYDELEKENRQLKFFVHNSLVGERASLLAKSKEKMAIYFKNQTNATMDSLTELEYVLENRLDVLSNTLDKSNLDDKTAYVEKIDALERNIKYTTQQKEEFYRRQQEQAYANYKHGVNTLANEPLTTETKKERMKKVNLEVKLGLDTISKLGMLLVMIGIVTGLQYTYQNFLTPELKGLLGFIIGFVFIMAGHYSYKSSKSVLGATFTGGGLGILYVATFWSYFGLEIINTPIAFGGALFISILSFILATIYNSKTIGCFGLIGGYLPIYQYITSTIGADLIPCVIYMLLLYAVTFGIAYKRGWAILDTLSTLCQLPFIFIYTLVLDTPCALSLTYYAIWLMLYLGSALIYPLRNGVKLGLPKIILMSINILITCVASYLVLYNNDYTAYMGTLSLVFALVYIGLTYLLNTYAPEEERATFIFALTSLTFAILTIPFQFGLLWLVTGWIIESALLLAFRNRIESKWVARSGWFIYILSILAVVTDGFYLPTTLEITPQDFNFTLVCITSWWILVSYLKEQETSPIKSWLSTYKYCVIAITPAYLFYLAIRLLHITGLGVYIPISWMLLLVLLGWGYFISTNEVIHDKHSLNVSLVFYLLADMSCFLINNQVIPPVLPPIIGICFLILFNTLAILVFYHSVKRIVILNGNQLDWITILTVIFTLFMLTNSLLVHAAFSFISLVISGLYLIAASGMIYYGFTQRLRYVRYVGLGLTIGTMAKLLLFDIEYYSSSYRIIAYFLFGMLLLGISYVYQQFSKKLIDEIESSNVLDILPDINSTFKDSTEEDDDDE